MQSSRRRFMIIAAAVALGSSAMPRSCPAQAACPLNYINGNPWSDPVQSMFCVPFDECIGGHYDTIEGIVEAWTAGLSSCSTELASASVTDVYVVANLPTGAPLTFKARLEPDWTVEEFGHARTTLTLTQPDGTSLLCQGGYDIPLEPCYEIAVTRLVGEPFQLSYSLEAGFNGCTDLGCCFPGDRWAWIRAHLVFLDLPPGAVVTSCQGFVQGDITAVEGGSERRIELAIKRLTPNPTDGAFAVTVTLPSDAPAVLEVFDVRGRLVANTFLSGVGKGERTVDVRARSQLASGIYFVRLTQGDRTAWEKEAVVR